MLAAALYVVDTLGPHVVSLTRHIKAERERVNRLPAPRSPGWGVLLQAINRRVTEGRPFDRVPSRIEPITRYAVDEITRLRAALTSATNVRSLSSTRDRASARP